MAEQLAYDVTARDRASRVLGTVGKAMKELGDRTEKLDKDSGQLADAQLRVRAAMLGVTKAEDSLTDARARLSKVTQDATATDGAKRKAALAVEAAEIRHARALRGVQAEGEKAARTARGIAAAQEENERATGRATRAQRAFGATAQATGKVTTTAYGGVSKTIGGVRVGVGGLFKGMALGVPIAGALGVGLLGLGKAVFDSAANMELLDRKSRIVFGRNFPEAVKWSKEVAVRMGLTSREVVGLAAGVQDLLIPMGFARQTAFGMSKDIVGLSGALSQWSAGQYDAAQVTEILRAAMLGERDSLQGLGISISQAQVDAQVLANKQRGVKFATDEQAQAQATLDLIYAKSTDAQKAFAGSTDTLASKQAKAKARFGEVRDAIVAALIPALSKLGDWFLTHQDDIINFGFQAAASVIGFGRNAGLAFGDILIGVGSLAGGLANLLDSSNTTFTGILRGAALALRVINPEASRAATGALAEFEKLRSGAVTRLRAIESKSTAAGYTLKYEVTRGSDAASAKLEQVRRAALGIPNKTLTQLNVEDRAANARIAATRRALRDPELTRTRKAKLEADLAKWEAQKKQIARDKANLAKAVYVPAGARAVPSGVKVVREKDASGVITGIRFGSMGARAGGGPGGPVRGPGTGTSDAAGIYRLSNDEHVLTAREVRGLGGHRNVAALRKQAAAAASGRVPGLAFGGPAADMNGSRARASMRSGLTVASDAGLRAAVLSVMQDAVKREGVGAFNASLSGALSFARAQAGKPYVWGGVGPGGYDCSGFLSALVNVAQGRNPYQRRFATGSLPAGLFAPGLGGAFQIGWFTGDPGHTAGTINGVNVESRGGDGVVVGARARGARAGLFNQHGSLKGFARGGRVGDPPFDLISPRGRGFRPAWPNGGDGSRAKALRRQISRGGPFYEDLSYPGMSRSYAAGVDRLAGRFWREHRGFDFGGPRTRPVVAGWLDRVVTQAIGNIRANRAHTAMADGGVIREPVLGIGRSGRSYSFGENGPETVTPGAPGATAAADPKLLEEVRGMREELGALRRQLVKAGAGGRR